jgi:hypothetical protein
LATMVLCLKLDFFTLSFIILVAILIMLRVPRSR